LTEARLGEYSRRVVRDDVHTAELLHEHDNPASQSSSAVAWNREEFEEHREEVLATIDLLF
jgi:hypothetical protein